MQMTNGPGFVDGGERVAPQEGEWVQGAARTRGTTFEAYTLQAGASQVRFAKITANLVHLLGEDDALASAMTAGAIP